MSALTTVSSIGILGVLLLSTAPVACRASGDESRMTAHDSPAPILLFYGTGTSTGDVESLKILLSSEHFNYAMVNSPQLNRMSESQILEHRLLIVPGGNFEQIGNNLTAHELQTFVALSRKA